MKSRCFSLRSLSVLLLALQAGAVGFAQTPLEVELVSPGRGDVTRYVSLPASVRADQQAVLYARVSGFLKAIHVDVGDTVKTGQVLAELEVPELSADVARYQAEAEVAASAAQRVEAARAKAPDLIVPAAMDEARGRLRVAEASLQRTQTLLGYARIVAPFDGTITARNVDAGAYVAVPASGAPTGAASVVTLMDFSTVRVVVTVPEVEAALVRVGQSVRVTVDTLAGKVFSGKVSRLAYALNEATRAMNVEIDLPNPEGILRPGMYARAGLGVDTHTDVMTLPAKAVLIEKSGASVFVVADGQAKKIPVGIGFNDGERLEISKGLEASQKVIVLGKTPPAVGQAVTVREVK